MNQRIMIDVNIIKLPCYWEHKYIRCGGDHRMVDCKAIILFVQSS